MSSVGEEHTTGLHLKLDIWHPDCWTLEVTEEANGGLFGHGVYEIEGKVKGRFTAYANSEAELNAEIKAIRESPLTDAVWSMNTRYSLGSRTPMPGVATRSLVVEYDGRRSISDAIISRGFIPDKPVWIHDGREYWTVIVDLDRETVQDRLDAVRREMDADIKIRQITSDDEAGSGIFQTDALSERQREAFELACEEGYYNWPREVTVTHLASHLDITKATFLEHLRKAEAKLFDSLP